MKLTLTTLRNLSFATITAAALASSVQVGAHHAFGAELIQIGHWFCGGRW